MLKVSKIEIYTRHLSLHSEVVKNTTIKHHSRFGTLGSSEFFGFPGKNIASLSSVTYWMYLILVQECSKKVFEPYKIDLTLKFKSYTSDQIQGEKRVSQHVPDLILSLGSK